MHQIFKKMLATRKLPTPSGIALEIMRLSTNENASLHDIADIVDKDPALSGKLLKYANTALFAATTPVVSVRKAIVRLGTDTVMGLALGFSLLSKNRKGRCEKFDYTGFWSQSLATAIAARSLAEILSGFEPDELFICGLLSRIGSLALASVYPQKYSEILERNLSDSELLFQESREFGIDHVDLTTELLEQWGIPEKYSKAWSLLKRQSPEDSEITGGLSDLINLLQLSGIIAKICMTSESEDIGAAEEMASQNAISPGNLSALLQRIVSRWQEWSILFEIPVRECAPSTLISSAEAGEPAAAEAREPFCILAVDDDPQTLTTLHELLANEATSILAAAGSDEALRLAIQHQPDLIIANWHMPDISGLDLCRMLRKTEFAKHLYIIILTASESDDELVQAFEAGADDYVGKPFVPKVLEARVRGGRRIIGYQEKMHNDRAIIQDYADQLTAVNKRFHTMAMTDSLTGLPNRRHAMERLQDMISESRRTGNVFSCIMIDIDHFKQINDTYGHDRGDMVLKEISAVFRRKSRTYDMISRFGGEEFLVVSELKSLEETLTFAERLRQQVAEYTIDLQGTAIRITISLGIAMMTPDTTESSSLIVAADRALYNAKRNGRNRVEVSSKL
jgi:two-component system cell cycle response regulator